MNKHKLIRITTIPLSLEKLLEGQLKYMNDSFEVLAVSSNKERLNRFAKNNSVNVAHIEMTRKITPFKDAKALFQLIQLFRKEKPNIVHTHTPKAGLLGMLAAKLANVPIRLHTVAGMPLLETTGLKRQLLNFTEKLTYWCSHRVYPNSYGLKNIISELSFAKEDKLEVIASGSSNGINTSHFNPKLFSTKQNSNLRNELNIYEKDFVFVFVGRLVGDKGINELIQSVKKVITSNQKLTIRLLLVGPFEQELDPLKEETIKEIKSNPNISTVGYQEDVRPYLAISDVLVFPSYREGFPNVVMQAGAMGIPSIVTDINGCNEIIEHQKNGIIIPPKEENSLFKAMIELLQNCELRKKMAENARPMITSRFEQQVVWEALLTEYQQLIKEYENSVR